MGAKYPKMERFRSMITSKRSPEEILKLNSISLKEYFYEKYSKKFDNIWSLRNQFKPLFDFESLKNKEKLKTIKLFCNNIIKGIIYYFLPGWYILGWLNVLRDDELRTLFLQKFDLAIYIHRAKINKKLRSIELDRGLVISLFIFAFSAVQYVFIRFQPFKNPFFIEKTLPLFCYPIETIKWETFITSDIAQKILLEEKNKIELFDNYLLIRRKKDLNLFGFFHLEDKANKDYWILKPEKIKKISQVFEDLDDLPKYLESSYTPTEETPEEELKNILSSSTSSEFQEVFAKKEFTSKIKTEINQLIRNYYDNSGGFLNLISILKRVNKINFTKYLKRKENLLEDIEEEVKEDKVLKETLEAIPSIKLNSSKLKYPPFDYLKVGLAKETVEHLEKKWGTSKDFNKEDEEELENEVDEVEDEEYTEDLDFESDNQNSLICGEFFKKDFSTNKENTLNYNKAIQKNADETYNKNFSAMIDLSFIKNPKLRAKLNKLYKKNKELFINSIDAFFNFTSKNKNSKIFINPRKMSGYKYPDLSAREVQLLNFKEFFRELIFPNRKTTLIKIELPPNLVFTKSFITKYPKPPTLKSLQVAEAKPPKPLMYKSLKKLSYDDFGKLDFLKNGVALKNRSKTLYNPEILPSDYEPEFEDFYAEIGEEEEDKNAPEVLDVNYKGPAALVNENNDVRVIYDATKKDLKPYLTRSEDSRLVLNVPFSYFSGTKYLKKLKTENNTGLGKSESQVKEENDKKFKNYFPEENPLRHWLLNYFSPDNPLSNTEVVFNEDITSKVKRKELIKFEKADSAVVEALQEEKIDFTLRKRAEHYNKKWAFFPYMEETAGEETLFHTPIIPAKKHIILVGISSKGWESRYPTMRGFSEFLADLASLPNKELDNEESIEFIEAEGYVNELMGYAVAELPTTEMHIPEPEELPNLEFGLVNETDYSPVVRALFRKISAFNFDPFTYRNLTENYGNTLAATNLFKRKNKHKRSYYSPFARAWEPLTSNSWLIIAQIAFAYTCCVLLKETAFNYGREFVSSVLDFLHEGGIVSPMVLDELKILIGEKDPGFRVAKDFTKGFHDVVGIEYFGEKFLDTFFYLRYGISNPIVAKHAQSLLLIGPPGTGKTLLVHALAHEAKVPVLTLSAQGSHEPASIERCFQEARRLAPCIVFFDEIDSIGQRRSLLMGEGDVYHTATDEEAGRRPSFEDMTTELPDVIGEIDPRIIQDKDALHMVVNRDVQNYLIDKNEKEYYRIGMLSKLLIELDGVDTAKGVVIIGATNRVEVLDPALLRPGRFYKHIRIGLPTKEKRAQLFKFYSETLGADPTIPWDYLVNVTYGFSAADIATIMNESSIQAIANASIHTLQTIEYGIDRITTVKIEKDKSSAGESPGFFSFSTVRSAYYQAGKALLGTLLKYHPPVRVVHLWYRHNSVRYNQILTTLQLEWLRYAFRGELEHRIIGAFGGKVGEFMFLQSLGDDINALNISNIGMQDWAIAQSLINLLVEKWHMYDHNLLFKEQAPFIKNFNNLEFNDVREQYLHEFSRIYEKIPTAINLLGPHSDKNPQTRYPLSWWQMKVYEQYLLDEIQKWFSIWLDDPEEWRFNIHWVPPDKVFHRNLPLENIAELINAEEFSALVRDYQIHSIVMESFNLAFVVLTEYRELLDQLTYVLLSEEILREYTIHEICANFGIDCNKLKEDLYNSEPKVEPLPKFKILYPSWGINSKKPTVRWIDIAAMLGEPHDFESEDELEEEEEEVKDEFENEVDEVENEKDKENGKDKEDNEKVENEIESEVESEVEGEADKEEVNEGDEEEIKDEKKEIRKRPYIHILSTFYPNVVKENNYIFPKPRTMEEIPTDNKEEETVENTTTENSNIEDIENSNIEDIE